MRKKSLLVSLVILALLVLAGPVAAKPPSSDGGASGNISLSVHAHSSQFTTHRYDTSSKRP